MEYMKRIKGQFQVKVMLTSEEVLTMRVAQEGQAAEATDIHRVEIVDGSHGNKSGTALPSALPCPEATRVNVEGYEELVDWLEEIVAMGKSVITSPSFLMISLDVWPVVGSSQIDIAVTREEE